MQVSTLSGDATRHAAASARNMSIATEKAVRKKRRKQKRAQCKKRKRTGSRRNNNSKQKRVENLVIGRICQKQFLTSYLMQPTVKFYA